MDWINQCHFGDCLAVLRDMPDGLVQTCVTSPPYFGSGTTGQVAQALGRQFIGIELNEAYKPLQDERLRQPSLLLEAA